MSAFGFQRVGFQDWDEISRLITRGHSLDSGIHIARTRPPAVANHALDGSLGDLGSRERDLDRREYEVHRREAMVEHRLTALSGRLVAAQAILVHAEERDARSEARDAAADKRENDLDLAELLAPADQYGYGGDWAERRNAALDRGHARDDRAAASVDLAALAEDLQDWANAVMQPDPSSSLLVDQFGCPSTLR